MGEKADQFRRDHTLKPPTGAEEGESAYRQVGDEVHIDPARAILIQRVSSCIVQGDEDSQLGAAFQVEGLRGSEEATVTHVASLQTLAKMVAQLIELAISTGEQGAQQFQAIMQEELQVQAENHMAYIEENQTGGS